jgi:hypothetical protein
MVDVSDHTIAEGGAAVMVAPQDTSSPCPSVCPELKELFKELALREVPNPAQLFDWDALYEAFKLRMGD